MEELKKQIIALLQNDAITVHSAGSCGELGDSFQALDSDIFDDVADKINTLVEKKIKDLQHYKDTTCGLWRTDRPELIKDEIGVMFQIGETDELNLINRIDGFCSSSLDPETGSKWDDVKKVLFDNRKDLKNK